MIIDFKCDAVVPGFNGGIVKVLLTVDSHPNSQQEVLLLNILQSRGLFQRGETYEVTFKRKITATPP